MSPNESTPALTSLDAQRVCTLSGVQQKILADKLVLFKDLEKTLEMSISEVNKANSDEYFWRAMEVCAKAVQIACDLLIAGLEKEAGPAGKAISVGYDVSKLIVDGFNNQLTAKKGIVFSTNAKVDAIADHLDDIGKDKFSKILSRAKVLANLANDLYEYWEEGGKDTLSPKASGLVGAHKTARAQLERIRAQIHSVSEALNACGVQI